MIKGILGGIRIICNVVLDRMKRWKCNCRHCGSVFYIRIWDLNPKYFSMSKRTAYCIDCGRIVIAKRL